MNILQNVRAKMPRRSRRIQSKRPTTNRSRMLGESLERRQLLAATIVNELEINDTADQAQQIAALSDLRIDGDTSVTYSRRYMRQSRDNDWFLLTNPRDQQIQVTLERSIPSPTHRMTLRLYDSSNLDNFIFSTTLDNSTSETFDLGEVEAGQYYAAIIPTSTQTGQFQSSLFWNYSIEFTGEDTGSGLEPDARESNNTAATASPLAGEGGDFNLNLHESSDQDFFAFTITDDVNSDHSIAALFEHGESDIDFRLRDSSGSVVGASSSVRNSESIQLSDFEAGDYTLEVFSFNGQPAEYTLLWNLPTESGPAPDRLESNDTFETATELLASYRNQLLTIHSESDEDYFSFELPTVGNRQSNATIEFEHADGDLDLFLYDAGGNEIDRSFSVTDDEFISFEGLDAGEYFLRVNGFLDATGNYSIDIQIPDDGLGPDFFESNDTLATATTVSSDVFAQQDLSIHSETDRDYFSFEITPGTSGEVSIDFLHEQGDIDLALLDASGNAVRRSASVSDSESIPLNGLPAGRYFVDVYGFLGATAAYDLLIQLERPDGLSPDRFETNESTAQPTSLREGGRLEGLSIHSTNDRDVFQFSLPSTGTNADSVAIDFSHSVGDLDLLVRNQSGSVVGQSYSVSDNEQVSLAGLSAGVYFAEVYGFRGARNAYDLDVNIGEGLQTDDLESNDSRQQATRVTRSGILSDLNLHNAGDQDWFGFNLPVTGTASSFVTVIPESGDLAVSVEIFAGSSSTAVLSGSLGTGDQRPAIFSLEDLAAGDYFVRVTGDAGAMYAVNFQLPSADSVRPDRFESNNSPSAATDLRSVEETREVEGLSITAGDVDYFSFRILTDATSSHFVDVQSDRPAAGLNIELLDASGQRLRGSSGDVDSQRVSLDGLGPGEYIARISADSSTTTEYDLVINGPLRESDFNIQLVFADDQLTGSFRDAFITARERWESIITTDIPDVVVPREINSTFVGREGQFTIPAGTQIDDVLIIANGFTDGPSGLLGAAGARALRGAADNHLAAFGVMGFDTADLQALESTGQLDEVIFHEMGHVILAPQTWQRQGRWLDVDTNEPKFLGENTVREYNAMLGGGNETTVPMYGDLNPNARGSHASHWDEAVFRNEIMTPFLNRGSNPVSRLTIAQAEDLGYGVNYAAAEAYTFPTSGRSGGEGEDDIIWTHSEELDIELLDGVNMETIAAPLESLFVVDSLEGTLASLRQDERVAELTLRPGDVDSFDFTLDGRGTVDHFINVDSELGRDVEIRLFNSEGQRVAANVNGEPSLSLAGFPSGDYRIEVQSDDFDRYALSFEGQFQQDTDFQLEPAFAALDVDGDGRVNLASDLRLIRFTLNDLPDSVFDRFIGRNATRSVSQIRDYVLSLNDALDLDSDGRVNLAADGRQLNFALNDLPDSVFDRFLGRNSERGVDEIRDRALQLVAADRGNSQSRTAEGESNGLVGEGEAVTQQIRLDVSDDLGDATFDVSAIYSTLDVNADPFAAAASDIEYFIHFNSDEVELIADESEVFTATSIRTNTTLEAGLAPERSALSDDGNAGTNSFVSFTFEDERNVPEFPGVDQPVTLSRIRFRLREGVDSTTITARLSTVVADPQFDQVAANSPLTVSVDSENSLPVIQAISDVTIDFGQTPQPIGFTVSDAETPADQLQVTASSNNDALIDSLSVSGSGGNRTLAITPVAGQSGTAEITVRVTDGDDAVVDRRFQFTVNPEATNDSPTISTIANRAVEVGQTIAPIAFTVADTETPAADLTVVATTDNPTLIENLSVSGTGGNRTLSIVLAAGQTGTANVTVRVTDADNQSTEETFTVSISETDSDTPPTITTIANRTVNVGESLSPITFVVGDSETAVDQLQVVATSSNTALIPTPTVTGTGASRSLNLDPVDGQTGTATITVMVTDGDGRSATESFSVTLRQSNIDGRILIPTSVARPHLIPGDGRPTAILFRAQMTTQVVVGGVGSVDVSGGPQILDESTTPISRQENGVTVADVQAGQMYAIIFPSSEAEQLYAVGPRSVDGINALSPDVQTNLLNVNDVNADGRTSGLDALLVLNQIRRQRQDAPEGEQVASDSPRFVDVNADGVVSPGDALRILNAIRRQNRSAANGEQIDAPELRLDSMSQLPARNWNVESPSDLPVELVKERMEVQQRQWQTAPGTKGLAASVSQWLRENESADASATSDRLSGLDVSSVDQLFGEATWV
ncbi:MAG: pre-peptidase C-terminal domain-containing protein [Planctomycetota bacterium]